MSQQTRNVSLFHLMKVGLAAMSDNEVEELWNRPTLPETRWRRIRLLRQCRVIRKLPLVPHDCD